MTNHSDNKLDDKTRDIFPDTTSLYKAFVDRMPTPVEIQPEYWVMEYGNTLTAAKNASTYVNKTAKVALQTYIERKVREARIEGMKQAKSRVLRRTEIPADAKYPTRDIVVLVGEECARIIDLDIEELQHLTQEEGKTE